jgi:hypothetical protein
MATLPTVPSFTFGETPSIAKLNQLANAVSFVSQMPIVVSLKTGSGQSIAAGADTPVQWTQKEVDTDGMFSFSANTQLTCQTQGYYKMHVTVAANIPSHENYEIELQQTTGVNNPAGSGHNVWFAGMSSGSSAMTADTQSVSVSAITPCLYVGDYVQVLFYCSAAVSVNAALGTGNTDNAGFVDGAGTLQMYYLFEGP